MGWTESSGCSTIPMPVTSSRSRQRASMQQRVESKFSKHCSSRTRIITFDEVVYGIIQNISVTSPTQRVISTVTIKNRIQIQSKRSNACVTNILLHASPSGSFALGIRGILPLLIIIFFRSSSSLTRVCSRGSS